MVETICKNCINLMKYTIESDNLITTTVCVHSILITNQVIKCSHFKPKPKQSKEQPKQKKALNTKGQTITAEELIRRRDELKEHPEGGIPLKDL